MSDRVTISVLMSVYNDNPYLADAVESILQQSFTNFEFVIVNDGSTDGSTEILKRYAESDDRIKLFHKKNKGLTKQLQFALQQTSGKFIVRMDGDDIAFSDRFEHQIKFMKSNPEVVCAGSNVLFIDEDNDPLGYSKQEDEHEEIENQLFKGRGGAIYHPTMMARTDAIKDIGGYNEKYRIGQDLDLFLKLGEIGKLGNSEKVTLKFRRYYKSTTALEKPSSGIARREEIIKKALKRRKMDTNRTNINITPPQTISEYHFSLSIKAIRSGFLKTAAKHLYIVVDSYIKSFF